MSSPPRASWMLASVAVLVAAAPLVVPERAAAQEEPASCVALEIEYSLSANLRLADTPMGEGDGVRAIGPGKAVLRGENKNGELGGAVTMRSYAMREAFVVKSKTLFWTTTVTVDSNTKGTPNDQGVVATGTLENDVLRFGSPVHGYRTDGTLTCDGSLCGKFGAPPAGKTELHIGPNEVQFKPWEYGSDARTFKMKETFVSKTDMPKQTAHIALSGREMKRTCLKTVADVR